MNIFFGLLLVIIGLSIFLGVFLFKLMFALILIIWGISLLTRNKKRDWNWDHRRTISQDPMLDETLILSPFNKAIRSDHFTGGKIVMILSGGELDLREAKPEGDTIDLEIITVLSGIKVFVPRSWKVVVRGTTILGEYESRAEMGSEATLQINGAAILGGVEIVN